MNIVIVCTAAIFASLISSLIGIKLKSYFLEKQYLKFKDKYGEVIEFTYQNKDATKTTFIWDGKYFKDKKE